MFFLASVVLLTSLYQTLLHKNYHHSHSSVFFQLLHSPPCIGQIYTHPRATLTVLSHFYVVIYIFIRTQSGTLCHHARFSISLWLPHSPLYFELKMHNLWTRSLLCLITVIAVAILNGPHLRAYRSQAHFPELLLFSDSTPQSNRTYAHSVISSSILSHIECHTCLPVLNSFTHILSPRSLFRFVSVVPFSILYCILFHTLCHSVYYSLLLFLARSTSYFDILYKHQLLHSPFRLTSSVALPALHRTLFGLLNHHIYYFSSLQLSYFAPD